MFCKRKKPTNLPINLNSQINQITAEQIEENEKKFNEKLKKDLIHVTELLVDQNNSLINLNNAHPNQSLSDAIQINQSTIKQSIETCESINTS